MQSVRFANRQTLPVDGNRLVDLLAFAMGRLGMTGSISLAVVDDETIIELNRRFLGREGPTDVMAFPLEDDRVPDPDPEIGEIVLSAATAEDQARDLGHPFQREADLLALHGLLHLAGRDDADPGERKAMLAEADALLEAFDAAGGGDDMRNRDGKSP